MMDTKKLTSPVWRITVLGLGIALYVAVSMALQMPFFENYYLCLGYAILAVYCCWFGPAAGALVGALGCVLHCLAINGLRGMPGWALGNLFTGLVLGFVLPKTMKKENSSWPDYLLTGLIMLAVMAIAMFGIKSFTEVLLYGQPMWARMLKNSYAFIANSFVLLASIPLMKALSAVMKKQGMFLNPKNPI